MTIPKIMGIVNCTPDSFFDGGKYFEPKAAFEHCLKLLDNGADILDIGGESTKPGFAPVSEEEEIARAIPVIEMLAKEQSRKNFQISIDTTKSNVALKAVKAGANIINDISAMEHDQKMLEAIIETKAVAILQHTLKYAGKTSSVSDVKNYLLKRAALLEGKIENIFIDPGIGFGKTQAENLALIANINELCQTKFPVLLGCSRKSYISKIKGLENSNRLIPSIISNVIAAQKGVKILRTHDVLETKEALATLEALTSEP
ncbi:MAG: dihydropteroate synthase [Fibromonadaceae bacterium]|jgi:dihydropteroate synthase|nr:dihydropteroate synthase [Fibromonadaceae bacterium]